MCQVIANYFGGDISIGCDVIEKLDCDNYDNGLYIIENWQIVDRKYHHGKEQKEYDLVEMLISIDEAQPAHSQIFMESTKEDINNMILNSIDK